MDGLSDIVGKKIRIFLRDCTGSKQFGLAVGTVKSISGSVVYLKKAQYTWHGHGESIEQGKTTQVGETIVNLASSDVSRVMISQTS